MVSYLDQAQNVTGDGGQEQLISNGETLKPYFSPKEIRSRQ
jgi:hypothetical protein